jgi:hypothetical protein
MTVFKRLYHYMTHLVTYSDENMTIAMQKCKISAYKNGIDCVNTLIPKDIDPVFFSNNKEVLTSPRGAGYWLWKPYVVNEIMKHCKENDVLIYSDAGVEFIAPVTGISDIL